MLMWQMLMLARVGIVSSCKYSTYLMALGNAPLPIDGGEGNIIVMVGFTCNQFFVWFSRERESVCVCVLTIPI